MVAFSFKKPPNWSDMAFYEKINYYKTQLDERFAPYVDKIEAKKIVKHICNDEISIAPIIRILSYPNDFSKKDINHSHIIKSSHGSKWNININKLTCVESVKQSLREWNRVYSYTEERQYTYIKPRFFIEQKVDGITGQADTYMFRCIYGKPVIVSVKYGAGNLQNIYDIHWNSIMPNELGEIDKPLYYDKMLNIACLLSKPFEFVRIDFFYINNIIYFSEFTFTPCSGHQTFSMDIEVEYGRLWT